MEKYINQMKFAVLLMSALMFLLFFTASCTSDNKRDRLNEQQFSDGNNMLYMYGVKPDEIEAKMRKRIFYFFPRIKGKPTDFHMRVETCDDDASCAIYFFQGNPVKVDCYLQKIIKEKRIKVTFSDVLPHKTTFQEQVELLKYLTYICESEIGIKDFAHLLFSFDDLGEFNVDITELCDSIKKVRRNKEEGIFPLAMEKTVWAEELRVIYNQYNIEFKDFMWYDKNKEPYNKYADIHQLKNKHSTPYVYIIDGFIVSLNKK